MGMRRIFCLLALLSVSISAQARDNLLPPCSVAQLGTLAEIQPAYETLIVATPSMFKRDSFLPYIEAYFAWREQLRSQVPLCAEIFEIAVLIDSIASNLVASPALSTVLLNAARPPTANPYLEEQSGEGSLPDELARRIDAVEALLNDDLRIAYAENDLPTWSVDDREIFYAEVFDPYFAFVETFARDSGIDDLLSAVLSLVEWRGSVWQRVPACAGMPETTWLMTQSASDIIVMLSYFLADMKPEFRRYETESSRLSAAIAQMAPILQDPVVSDVTLPESSLPGCAHAQLSEFLTILPGICRTDCRRR